MDANSVVNTKGAGLPEEPAPACQGVFHVDERRYEAP
jgi:hypothetical protein